MATVTSKVSGLPYFNDLNGDPLDNGDIWIGVANTDPRQNPIPVFYDEAATIPAIQPLRVLNGHITRAGSVAEIFMTAPYSIYVQNKRCEMVYYLANVDEGTLSTLAAAATSVPSIAALRLVNSAKSAYANVASYYGDNNGGGGFYVFDATDTTTPDNGGTVIVGVAGARWKLQSVTGGVTLKQFGAKGNGAAADGPFVAAAFTACSNGGLRLDVTPGRYKCATNLTTSGMFTLRGTGMSASVIELNSNSSWTHNGGALSTAPTNQLTVKGLSLQTADTLNTSTALLNVNYNSGANGSTVRAVTIEDVEVCGTTLTNGFNGGIRLFNATTLKINRVRVTNANTGPGGYTINSFGIRVDTDSQAGDWYIDQTNVYFCSQGVSAIGQGNNQGFEGLTMTNCSFIANQTGFALTSSVSHLYVRLDGCNINSVENCILIQNFLWISITSCMLYAYDTGVTVPSWIGINIQSTDVAHGLSSTNVIEGNAFSGFTTTHATSKNGIVFQSNANGLDTMTVIAGNSFTNLNTALVLFSGNNNIKFTDTNQITSTVTASVADSSGQTNNIFAFAAIGNPGAKRDNAGVETKWASGVAVTLSGGAGTITFPQAFATALDSVVVINGNPGGTFGANVVGVVNSSFNKTGFGISVNGATTGTITINYIAVGH